LKAPSAAFGVSLRTNERLPQRGNFRKRKSAFAAAARTDRVFVVGKPQKYFREMNLSGALTILPGSQRTPLPNLYLSPMAYR
jgi:hypothetical protein